MANYSLVVNSLFRPFSYLELVAPLQLQTDMHNQLEDAYGELAAKANIWDNMANELTDPHAYKMYKSFANDLKTKADLLATEGLTPSSRQAMIGMKTRYSKEIVPIELAYARRRALQDELRKALLADPTLMFQRNLNLVGEQSSLDRFIENPNYDYGEMYSGKMLTALTALAASALAKQMRDNPRKWRDILHGQYYETLMLKGFTPEAVLLAIQNSPEAAKELTRIVEDTIGSSKIKNWGDKNTVERAYDYARQGLWSAVGETLYLTLENWRAKMNEQRAAATAGQQIQDFAINPLNIYSSKEQSKEEAQYQNAMRAYSDYFYKDKGQWKMNLKGWKEYNKKMNTTTGNPTVTPEGTVILTNVKANTSDSPFKQFMDSHGMKGMSSTAFGPWQRDTAGAIWDKYANNSPVSKIAKFDATRVTEFDYPIASSQQGDMKDAIMTAGRGLSLKEVDYDNKSKKFKDTGEEITMENLKSDKYKVTATRFSPYGSTVMIQDDKGNVRRFRMPAGINTTNEQNRDRAMDAANQWQQIVNTGQYTDAKGNVHQATPYEITYAQNEYKKAIQQAYLFHSQLGVLNKTKEQEFNHYGY